MPIAPGKTASRRHTGECGSMTAGLPSPALPGAGRHRLDGWTRDGKRKMAPERSAMQNLPASHSGAMWQGGHHALRGKGRRQFPAAADPAAHAQPSRNGFHIACFSEI